jgi:hypothetical protein
MSLGAAAMEEAFVLYFIELLNPERPVCGELLIFRANQQFATHRSEIRRCSVAASDMTEGLRLEEDLRRCVERAWPTRCDTGVGCKRLCNSRASAQDRFGSKIGSDQDTRAVPYQSVAQRKDVNEEYREWL